MDTRSIGTRNDQETDLRSAYSSARACYASDEVSSGAGDEEYDAGLTCHVYSVSCQCTAVRGHADVFNQKHMLAYASGRAKRTPHPSIGLG